MDELVVKFKHLFPFSIAQLTVCVQSAHISKTEYSDSLLLLQEMKVEADMGTGMSINIL